jgi:hypothetical protein
MDYFFHFAGLAAPLLALIAGLFLVIAILRSYKIPECVSCGGRKVRPSRRSGVLDSFGLTRAYRCEGCQERFHGLPLFIRSEQAQQGPRRLVTIAFRFRRGIPNRIAIRIIQLDPRLDPRRALGPAKTGILPSQH